MHVVELNLSMPIVSAPGEGEEALVTRLRRGERTAVSEAYTAHHAPVRAFARRLLGDAAAAEDVVHDTFLALPRAVAGFRGAASLRSFLIGVAANRARRHVRSVARRRRAMANLEATSAARADHADGPDVLAQRRRLAERLTRALDELAHDQRVAFVLCEVEQRTSVEVAAILAVPEGTVRSRVFHARRRLRDLLAEEVAGG
ncbi:MAG: RNA polymerase sigma factor [Kofleriaceae bacterium]